MNLLPLGKQVSRSAGRALASVFVIAALLLGGCSSLERLLGDDEDAPVQGGGGSGASADPNWYPPGGSPQYTSGGTTRTSQGSASGSAACKASTETAPQGVPVPALQAAEDRIIALGNSLNEFWRLDSCVFAADTTLYPECKQNALSFSMPRVVLYDQELFAEFDRRYNSTAASQLFTAHEWGHQVQFVYNVLGANPTASEMEADADRRAGYFLGWVAQQDGSSNASDIADLLGQIACAIGGSDTPTYFDPYAHGSCQTRMNNVVSGFNEALRTSTVGRRLRADPNAPAATAAGWVGRLGMSITVINDQGVVVDRQVPFDYSFTIGANGKVIDEQDSGPLPDVGAEKTIPIQTQSLQFDIIATTTSFSFDDNATRYHFDLRVDEGTVGSVAVTGSGTESIVFSLLPDGQMNVYMFDTLTLRPASGNNVTVVIETKGTAVRE